MAFTIDFGKIGDAIGAGLQSIGTYSAQAAAQANNISRQAQSAQGAFNQASANQANMINDMSMANQMGFNSAMMTNANEYNTGMWEKAAQWNEQMWEKQAKFNAEQAQIQRDWQTQMANTQYQRAVKDMEGAGLNPILAVTGGGVNGSVPSGAVASVGGAQMSSAQSQMASAGLLGANTASEGNFQGQMEQMSSTLALLGAIFSGISSATDAAGGLGETGQKIIEGTGEMLETIGDPEKGLNTKNIKENWNNYKKEVEENGGWWQTFKDTFNTNQNGGIIKDRWGVTKKADNATYNQYSRQNDFNKTWNKYHKPKG